MLNDKNVETICKRAIEKWGERAQLLMVVEECAELQKAILKFIRWQDAEIKDTGPAGPVKNAIYEECADILIMIEQLRMMPSIRLENITADQWINMAVVEKLARLKKRLGLNDQKEKNE